ncbi:Mitogen-activated protein kinase kinase kinase 20 [Linum grandiflorum]
MAVKSAPLDNASSLILEYKILSEFRGTPGIIQCLDEGTSHDQPCCGVTYNLVLEYAAGGSLHDLIKYKGVGGIQERHVRVFIRTLLEALLCIHAAGYVHCDIKSDNVLVFPDSKDAGLLHLKIADFGLAIKTRDLDPRKKNYRGTSRYQPQEVVVSGKVSPAMDIWALGCTVVEMVTGKRLFQGFPKKSQVLMEIGNGGQPEIPDWLSEDGKDFLKKCFTRSSTYRLPARKLLLHPFVAGRASLEKPLKTTTTTTAAQVHRRNKMLEQAKAIFGFRHKHAKAIVQC